MDYQGVSGSIDFDAHGDVTQASYLWWEVRNRTFVTLEVLR